MDHTTLAKAIHDKDIKVLSWYVQHSEGAVMVHELDAEARMAYYQLLYSQQQAANSYHSDALASLGATERGARNFASLGEATLTSRFSSVSGDVDNTAPLAQASVTGSSIPRWFEFSSSSVAEERRDTVAEQVRSAASISLREASRPLTGAPQPGAPLHYLLRSSSTASSSASAVPSAASADAPNAALGSTTASDLPLLLQRKLSRRLFRSYSSYLGNNDDVDGNTADVAYGSPKGETSTFLLSQVDACVRGGSLLSPRSHVLEQRNVTLHEDEEREDIAAMEAYEVHTLTGLMHDSLQRALRQTQARERVDAATVEAEDRLRISLLQSQMWTAFSNAVWTWLHGPAKEQNALLMNESVLRNRIALEEEKERSFLLSFHLKEAENQLTEHRRLRWLLQEHDRANTMHKQLMMALALQGVDSPSTRHREESAEIYHESSKTDRNNPMRFEYPSIEAQIMQRFNSLNRRTVPRDSSRSVSLLSPPMPYDGVDLVRPRETTWRSDQVPSSSLEQERRGVNTLAASHLRKAPHGSVVEPVKECAVS